MECPHCALNNENGAFFCRGCRALYLSGTEDALPPPEDNERVLLLAQACELVRARTWSLTEFRQYLNDFETEQARREKGIRGVDIPFGLEEDFAEEQQVGFDGVEACNRGLQLLEGYDPEATGDYPLSEGLRLFYQGILGVKEAMKINRRSYGRPLWL